VIAPALVLLALLALSTFLGAAQHQGTPPAGDFVARRLPDWDLSGPAAEQRRKRMLLRAQFRLTPDELTRLTADVPAFPTLAERAEACRFLNDPPSGTTAKFNCVLDGGTVIKVKYGRNPEIQGEVAGTHLLRLMGFPADDVAIVPRLRCYGCPREPFITIVASNLTYTRQLLGPAGFDNGYTDFDWVAIERKFPAPAIETDTTEGWAWWELRHSNYQRADLDALRLLAVFMAHWDNKSENQRLVCLDGPPPDPSAECSQPLAMIQDLGATFGPTKVNIASWSTAPIWADARICTVTMRSLPWHGGTFPDVQITEAGRRQIADGLASITDDQLRELFRSARFAEYQTATDNERDLHEWIEVFKTRTRQIIDAGPCPLG
jgi:hypothetical protein